MIKKVNKKAETSAKTLNKVDNTKINQDLLAQITIEDLVHDGYLDGGYAYSDDTIVRLGVLATYISICMDYNVEVTSVETDVYNEIEKITSVDCYSVIEDLHTHVTDLIHNTIHHYLDHNIDKYDADYLHDVEAILSCVDLTLDDLLAVDIAEYSFMTYNIAVNETRNAFAHYITDHESEVFVQSDSKVN